MRHRLAERRNTVPRLQYWSERKASLLLYQKSQSSTVRIPLLWGGGVLRGVWFVEYSLYLLNGVRHIHGSIVLFLFLPRTVKKGIVLP